MKKVTIFFIVACLVLSSFAVFAEGTSILINGVEVQIGEGMGRVVERNDRTFVPVRFVLQHFGYEVTWDGERQIVLGRNDQGKVFIMQIGSPLLYFLNDDGEAPKLYKMDVEPFLNYEEERTYIPLRFLAEGLEYKVGYDEATRTVTLDK